MLFNFFFFIVFFKMFSVHVYAEKTNLSLQVLPMLFPAGVRKQGKRSIQRATVEESIRGFVNVEKVRR